jgi:large subunit ribosomal protein L7A
MGGYIMISRLEGKKIVGAKQTIKTIKSGRAAAVYIAKDAESKVTIPVEDLCKENNVEIIHVTTMRELGQICGIDVGAATAALIKE